MEELFSNADIDYRPISEYVKWFLNEDNKDYNIVQLPPIQRNSVWDSKQVELLWDSLLRGFPIGSFLLSPRKIGSKTRNIYSTQQNLSEKEGFFLLDGQQRTRAILLGFKPNGNSRLWIDLNPKLSFGNSEFNDRQFLFRLITSYQPWGMNDKNPNEKLREPEKYKARTELYNNSVRYDYEVKINISKTAEAANEKYSWPIKATLPIPFDCLVDLCGGFSGKFIQPNWNNVLEFIPNRFKGEFKIEPTQHFYLIIEALRKLLDLSDPKKVRAVAFLKQNDYESSSNEEGNIQDPIEVLFRRINSGGTVLAGEEMAYSLLKSSWDDSYDLVSNVVNDKNIGYLFSPTGVVMAATRISRFNWKESDDANPSVSNFRKWIGERKDHDKKSFLGEIMDLMEVEDEKSKFHLIMDRFCKLVLFRERQSPIDIGLPRKLLLSIKPTMLHPILIWLYNKDSNTDEENRIPILRYLIYSFFGIISNRHDKASKKTVEILKNCKDVFPDREIYKQWLNEKNMAIQLPPLEIFSETFSEDADGFLRELEKIKVKEGDIYRDFRITFWYKKELLLWFQREFYAKWFVGYNPMSNDAYDTPYDYDHIVPYSHLINSGSILKTGSNDTGKHQKFSNCRYSYVNSIGNLRMWPSWANRSDNNSCHTKKLKMENEFEINTETIDLSFKSNNDFILASSINIEDFELWKKAGGKPMDWNQDRRKAWQEAVEKRVLFLFQNFYDSFEFSKWTNEE